jgi:hypothetical protein
MLVMDEAIPPCLAPTNWYNAAVTRRPYVPQYRYSLFGLTIATDLHFGNHLLPATDAPDLTFHLQEGAAPVPDGPVQQLYPKVTPADAAAPRPARVRLTRSVAGYNLSYAGVATFEIADGRITAYDWQPEKQELLEIFFLGPALAFYLEQLGIPAVHAAAVVVGKRAVAFLGSKSGGKSSLAAGFVQHGYPLLADDILALELRDGAIQARPAYPQMRLWPEQARHFLGHERELEFVHPAYPKYRVPVGPGTFGTFCPTPRSLACIYLPERRDPARHGTAVQITPLTRVTAVMALIRHSFIASLVQAADRQAERLAFFAQLAQQVPLRRLRYPNGLEYLPQVRHALLQDDL